MLVIENHKPLIGCRVESPLGKGKVEKGRVVFADDLPDLFRWLEATPRVWAGRSSEKSDNSHDWDLGAGWQGTLAMARDGWSEGARDLSDRLAATPAPTDKTQSWRYDVAGSLPDVPRFLSGDPLNMRDKGKQKGRAAVVHLVVNGCASAAVGAREMANYGTAIVAMIDRLENSGRRVELDVVFFTKYMGAQYSLNGWKVKRASDPLDLAAVAFSIAHPAAFRRLGFAMKERTPKDWETRSYGYSCDIVPEALPEGSEGAFLLDGVRHSPRACSSLSGALIFAAEQINKAAGETLIELEELKQVA